MQELIIQEQTIVNKIYYIRGQKVMLDEDLAEIYGVEIKRLNEAVKRNSTRFPEDFIFQLTDNEEVSLRSQIATLKKSKSGRGQHRKYLPYAFTEHGVVMLASVLNSNVAIRASILVVRAFVSMRHFLLENQALAKKVEELERQMKKKFAEQDGKIDAVFEAIQQLIQEKDEPREPIGFKLKNSNN
jgi:phage regulator Rha-like protein